MKGVQVMAVPPILISMYEALVGIFTGTVRLTVLVVITLFITKFFWDILTDWIFGRIKKYLNFLAFPGAFFHQLFHSLAIKMLGYKVKVNFHMSFALRDVTSQSLSGELRNVYHAFLIGMLLCSTLRLLDSLFISIQISKISFLK